MEGGGRLGDKEFESLLRTGFSKLCKGSNTMNFLPILIANNQIEGGLGPSRFHVIKECGLSEAKLLGKEPINEQDFVIFYLHVSKEVPRLKFGSERIKKVLEFTETFLSKEEYTERVNKLVKFFEHLDKDHSGYLDKNEVKDFYHVMSKKEIEKTDEESERAFQWVDRNKSGTIELFELISSTMSKTMLEKTKEEWYQYLASLGLDINAVN